ENELILPAKVLAAQTAHSGCLTALAFSTDGRLLASGGIDDCVRIWSIANQRVSEMVQLRRELNEVQALVFAPNETFLISGSLEVGGRMWRWDWREKGTNERTLVPDEPARVDTLAFSPTGKFFAASAAHLVLPWSVSDRDLRRKAVLKGHEARVRTLAFST